jgi:hypothetical protein
LRGKAVAVSAPQRHGYRQGRHGMITLVAGCMMIGRRGACGK